MLSKTMTEMRKVEKKPSNVKSSYFLFECKNTLSDEMNLPNSQPLSRKN